MSWESSAAYYEGVNKGVQARLGGLSSAELVLVSVDFARLIELLEAGDHDQVGAILADAAQRAERAGAEVILICSTTFHVVHDRVAAAVSVPVLHQADALAERCKAAGITSVGFIGTAYTMQNDFFAQRLSAAGVDVAMPDEVHYDTVDALIYDELVFRKVNPSSRKRLLTIIDELTDAGTQGVILGATELSLLVRPGDVDVPVLDVITAHVDAVVQRALG